MQERTNPQSYLIPSPLFGRLAGDVRSPLKIAFSHRNLITFDSAADDPHGTSRNIGPFVHFGYCVSTKILHYQGLLYAHQETMGFGSHEMGKAAIYIQIYKGQSTHPKFI